VAVSVIGTKNYKSSGSWVILTQALVVFSGYAIHQAIDEAAGHDIFGRLIQRYVSCSSGQDDWT